MARLHLAVAVALASPLAVLGLLALPGAAAGRTPWLRPVAGPVVRGYDFRPADRYAAGRHRGVTLAARPGAGVHAPCGGEVLWTGAVGATGRGVTIACGALNATLTHLGAVLLSRGGTAAAGQVVARAGVGGVQLGARVRAEPVGYVDPMSLLGRPRVRYGPPPAPLRPRPTPAAPAAAPAHARSPLPEPDPGGGWIIRFGEAAVITALGIGAARAAPPRFRAALVRRARRGLAPRRAR